MLDSGNRIYGIEDLNARRCLPSWGPGQGGDIYRNQSGPGSSIYNRTSKSAVFTVTRVGPGGGIYGNGGPAPVAAFTVTADGPEGGIYGNGGRARGGPSARPGRRVIR